MKLKVPSTLFRSGTAVASEDGTIRMSISSDEPYERYDFWNDKTYMEVLDHSEGGVDLSRLENGAALLYNHDRDVMLGTLSNPECVEGRCYVTAKMSSAPDVESYRIKVGEGILKDTSIGYTLKDEGEQIGKTKDGTPILKFKFAIHEASLVTIPADPGVGIGRQRSKPEGEPTEILIHEKKDVAILENENKRSSNNADQKDMPDQIVTPEAPKIDVKEVETTAITNERKRVGDIQELSSHFKNNGLGGRKIDTSELASQFIKEGKSLRDFQDAAVRGNFPDVQAITTSPEIGMSKRDLTKYSLFRAIQVMGKKHATLDGLERELSDETYKKTGISPSNDLAFCIPWDVIQHKAEHLPSLSKRTLVTNVFSGAGAFVDTTFGSMVELLRNKSVVTMLGARTLTGLQGNLALPTQTGASTVYWVPENGTITASDQTVGQVTLTPHRMGCATAYSLQMLAQSTPDLESFVRDDLMTVLALAQDKAALVGKGAGGEPLGVANMSGLSTTVTLANAGTMTFPEAIRFETNLANANADMGTMGYVTTPTIRGVSKGTPLFSSTGTPIWINDMVNGYAAKATLQHTTDFAGTALTTATVIFGNWADMIIGVWGGQEVIVDPYSLSLQGQVRVVMQQLIDVAIRHAKSFAVSSN